jgi:hypothetical protein
MLGRILCNGIRTRLVYSMLWDFRCPSLCLHSKMPTVWFGMKAWFELVQVGMCNQVLLSLVVSSVNCTWQRLDEVHWVQYTTKFHIGVHAAS